ncbi:EAL domain-containing protein [uncultured Paraglaciecola sp.]|uniref:putative bifunctional diguanylate cyclase/phosphodiesterase n=1 Tax=uncultured Paraglaciecola sp. TaxID=1765024 RepID=UPI0030D9C8E2|tara:strand:- start:118826 stop:120718 length:1893 start_codon:yes stop_codon:yes gene_type:complete
MSDTEDPSAIDEITNFRAKRLRQLLYITLACLNLGVALIYIFAYHLPTLLTLVGCDIMMLYALHTLLLNKVDKAASILLWSISVGLTIAVLLNSGLRDPAILSFPAILFFAALMCSRREFTLLYVYFCTATVLIGLTHLSGLRNEGYDPVNIPNIAIILLILTAASLSIRTISHDLRSALSKLEKGNRQLKISKAKAQYMAQYDELTGLPNRSLCQDRFNYQMKLIQRHGGQIALLFIDLDNFKTINDSLGHSVGDQVLKTVAGNLAQCLRKVDTAGRFGGDEFIVLLTEVNHIRDVQKTCNKILNAVNQNIVLDSYSIQTSASIGIAMAPKDGADFDSYCKKADIAMYQAKADGKNLFRFFDASMNTVSQERFVLIKDLRDALKQNQLTLFYQPKVDLRTARLVGAEALIRWQHPERGLIAPRQFIELAEETGLIVEIGDWVLEEACRQCRSWHEAGYPDFEVAVNLSSVQFARGNLTEQVEKALSQSGLAGKYLELELTESLLLGEGEHILTQLSNIKNLGVSFSIDDFGTGYSNLSYLSKYNLDALKIDQSFVFKMLESKQNLNIIIAIINIAKSLDLTVVAEGIESAETLEKLTQLGCEFAQGYYWAKPQSSADFLKYVEQNNVNC